MEFLNRFRELERLDRLTDRKASGLVAVWGRRRVGKTRMLVEWCQRKEGVYTVADQSSPNVQRQYFAETLSSRFVGFAETTYPDWATLFRRLSRDARSVHWRGPLVIDEFPYWVAASPELPSVLQRWIDEEARNGGLLVVIAGSSQRMMQGLVLDASAPLYGRALEAMAIEPIHPPWIQQALGLRDPVKAFRAYAIWGGIPRYWELAQPFGEDLDEAVDTLALDPQGPLHREPDRLLLEELPPAVALRPLLDAIGGGAHRLSEMATRVGQPATSLARPLSRLCELGLVEREIPHGASEKSGKRALYRIRDPFFRFWFRVVAPHRATLTATSPASRRAIFQQHAQRLFAEAWEALCLWAVNRGETLDHAPFSASGTYPAHRWWHGNAPEWDVVATNLSSSQFIVGEAKWSEKPFSNKEVETLASALLRRPLPPGVKGQIDYVLFVPSTRKSLKVTTNGVYVIDAQTIFGIK